MKNKNLVGSIFRRSLLVYILSDLAYTSGPLVDGIITGNYLGVEAVAAVSLIAPSIFVFTFAMCILASGSQSVCTELFGRGQVDEANSVFTLANVIAAVISIAIASFIVMFPHSIMQLLGASGNIASYGADYLRGWAFGLVFLYCSKIMHGFMNLDNDNSRAFYAVTAMTITNIAGDFYVVLFTNLGMFGLALTTSLSNVVYFAVIALHFRKKNRILQVNFQPVKNFLSTLLNICKQGSMSAFSRITKSLAGIAINHIIIHYAASYELAAYGAQNQMLSLVASLYLGTAYTIWIMSSVYYGE